MAHDCKIQKIIKNDYISPRWSGEILDCSMPMTFDTYSHCSYNCLYCFSYFQKSHSLGVGGSHSGNHSDYQSREIRSVNVEYIKKMFLLEKKTQFEDYISEKRVMQWGGLADPFDEYERKYGVTLELLKFFKTINYPLCFSTKATWWLDDERYTALFKNQKNWNCKFSIINLDKQRAARMEKGVPSPQERLEALGKYARLNAGGATLRLRPFIIGFSDRDGEHLKLIKLAKENGATALSTEFFCLETRANERLKKRYKEMSDIITFDVFEYYKRFSRGAGYRRLNRKIKRKYIDEMEALCGVLGVRFYVSDAHFKERCCNGSCCGLPESWNYSRGQFTQALLIAKRKGKVYFSDISKGAEIFRKFSWNNAVGFNSTSSKMRAMRRRQTMYDYIRSVWNSPKKQQSPYKYFGGILIPEGFDEAGDVIYIYNG